MRNLARVSYCFLFYAFFSCCCPERLDSSPGPEFTPVSVKAQKSGKRKSGEKKGPNQIGTDKTQLRQLKKWVLDNSMKPGERNLTAAEIVIHIKECFNIEVSIFVFFFFFLFIESIILLMGGGKDIWPKSFIYVYIIFLS